MVQANVNYGGYRKNNPMCEACKGEGLVPNDQKATQENSIKRFGIINNYCVNGQEGEVLCPYSTK